MPLLPVLVMPDPEDELALQAWADVEIGGATVRMLLDTGAGTTAIPWSAAVDAPTAETTAPGRGASGDAVEGWHRVLALGGVDGTRADAYALTVVGYMGNNALPARAGDVIKAMLSASRARAARRDAFGALLAERLLDAAALLVIFAALVAVADPE